MTRQHGTRACYVHGPDTGSRPGGCRCDACCAANTAAYHRDKTRVAPTLVDATEVREHVRALMAAGVGLKTIAKRSGVAHGALSKLIYGDPARGRGPSRRIRIETRDRLLTITAKDHAAGAKIPAKPTWRHVRTLQARGWTKKAIAHAIGQQGPGLQLGRRLVSARNARAIEALLDQPVPDRWDCHGNLIRSTWTPEGERAEQARLEVNRERQARLPSRQTAPAATEDLVELLNPPPVPQLDRAACTDKPTWMFYPAAHDEATIAAAKKICAACPVRQRCLDDAINRGEQFGIWGGTTEAERAPYQPWSVAS